MNDASARSCLESEDDRICRVRVPYSDFQGNELTHLKYNSESSSLSNRGLCLILIWLDRENYPARSIMLMVK